MQFIRGIFCIHIHVVIITIVATALHHVSAGDDEGSIMGAFAKSLTPASPGWSGNNHCKWSGVSCDSSGRVTSISLSYKSVYGQLPQNLNNLSQLKTLNLQGNHLSGAVPSLSDLDSLEAVYLDGNNFTSVSPSFISGLKSLTSFSISENPNLPPWTFPDKLTESSSLTTVYASRCGLTGNIPDIFESLPSLQSIRLSYNNLTGPLPPSLAKSSLQNLWVNNQVMGLSGGIDVIGTMSQLRVAWLHSNQFSGPIPNLTECTSLVDLQLRDNQLTGVVPDSLSSLPMLANVTLQNNKLQGPIPVFKTGVQVSLGNTNNFCNSSPGPCDPQVTVLLEVASALGYPMKLAEGWQGNNPCKNWVLISCDINGKVSVINFGKMNWTGTISPAIANLTALKRVNLNDNRLVGPIPASLASLAQLQYLDVSNNDISGKLPNFSPGVTFKYSGNPNIGKDIPVPSPSGAGGGTPGSSGASGATRTASASKPWIIAGIVIAVLFVISLLAVLTYERRVKKATGGKNGKASENNYTWCSMNCFGASELPGQSSDTSSDIQLYDGGNVAIPVEVLREVTNNFSGNNIIGRGGFGVVYKGRLHDGTEIAVKRMESGVSSSKGLYEFKAEIEVLTRVRHRHLVALHGFCVNGNERLLVYEYMPKGTLGQHLFEWKEIQVPPLTWTQRVSVALDVARGVEYLHSLAQQSFIHRDLKPSNILLDDEMRAKVSDFGLVKSAPNGGKYSMETRLAGTFGYLAPEYAATGRVTTKVDIFAYGVVLMEIITGRKALDESLSEDQGHLVSWFRKATINRVNIRNFIDPNLDPDEETLDSIYKVTELAGHCTARELSNRPDMGHVVNILSPMVQQWKPSVPEEESHSFAIDLHMSLPQALQRWQANESMKTNQLYNATNMSVSTSTPGEPSNFPRSFGSSDAR